MNSHLILTESGFFLATNDVSDDFDVAKHYSDKYKDLSYSQFINEDFDDNVINYEMTSFLNAAFPPQNLPSKQKKFQNELSKLPETPEIANHKVLFDYKPIADGDFSKMIKKLGYTINKDIRDIYVNFDRDGDIQYFCNGKEFSDNDYLDTTAYIVSDMRLMNFNMPRYIIKNEDYQKYQRIEMQLQRDPACLFSLSPRDYTLHSKIDAFQKQQKKLHLTMVHECHHQKNHFFKKQRKFKKSAKLLSCENIYKINVEDERSAKFSEVLFAVNEYLKTGNDVSLTACKSANTWLENLLSGKTPKETKDILTNHALLLNRCLSFWNFRFADAYNSQFANNCRAEAKQFSPLPDEKENEEFNKLRKMFYTFEVYNPETKKTEYKDFSKLIDTDIKINEKANAIIKECENIRQDVRKKMFDLCKADKRYLSAIPLAHHLLKEKIKNIGKNDDVCLIIPQKQKETKGKNISAVLAKQKEKSK